MQAESSEIAQRFFRFVRTSPDAYALFDPEDALVFSNSNFSQLLGKNPDEIKGQTFAQLAEQSYGEGTGLRIDADDLDGWLQYVQSVRRSQEFRLFEVLLTDERWFLFSEQLDEDGYLLVHAKDISEQKRLEERIQQSNRHLRHLALTDPLTELPNRRYFEMAVEAELNRCWRKGGHAALLIVDIDHFKKLNDEYGHSAGDEALKELGKLIQRTMREYDIYGRLGGEEFGIFISQEDEQESAMIAERLRQQVESHSFQWETHQLTMTISIGVARGECDTPYAQLFEKADEALYAAKESGRNKVIAA